MTSQTGPTGPTRQPDRPFPPRVYPLDPAALTQEQIAVTFAMTSRRPEPFDEIARQVSQENAADFHDRWVVGYGHASVAEHAVVHLAVENFSRIAVDELEDNRLASYTEKSSRYQLIDQDAFHIPAELDANPELRRSYIEAARALFAGYAEITQDLVRHLEHTDQVQAGERPGQRRSRLRRQATDASRSLLPAATLTNVGLTANARTLEHMTSKLLSGNLQEQVDLGNAIRDQGRAIAPTLLKYAQHNPHLTRPSPATIDQTDQPEAATPADQQTPNRTARLLSWQPTHPQQAIASALLYRNSGQPFQVSQQAENLMTIQQRDQTIQEALARMGPHDSPPREFELVHYTFEFLLDYGAYREFKRHRMQTFLPQPITARHGVKVPDLVAQADLQQKFHQAMQPALEVHHQLARELPDVAPYITTHAHYRRVLTQINLRQCYHLFQLRTSLLAHASIRQPITEAMREVVRIHEILFSGLQLRNQPDWWPFPATN